MSGRKILAALTIGQAPRTDLIPDIEYLLPPDLEIRQYGALDDLTMLQIEAAFDPKPGDEILVSRMRDGSQAHMTQRFVEPRIQELIHKAEAEGANAVALFCTGRFGEFAHKGVFLEPQPLLHAVAKALAGGQKIGVLVPVPGQVEQAYESWGASGVDIFATCASPYLEFSEVVKAASIFAGKDLAFVCCDCMGYTTQMKQAVSEACGLPVLLARSLAARILAEMLS
ncbi:MAG: AroM family protein [Coriobacteriales bacterium]|nr:AroM family protein [Coriobacteriales bacterium]